LALARIVAALVMTEGADDLWLYRLVACLPGGCLGLTIVRVGRALDISAPDINVADGARRLPFRAD